MTKQLVPALIATTLVMSLACSGLFSEPADSTAEEIAKEAAKDAQDPAEQARRNGDFLLAQSLIEKRLAKNPNNARALRLMGDINWSRGRMYPEKWKDNLRWALANWQKSVTINPTSCTAWERIATGALAAQNNDEVAMSGAEISALPLAKGQEACPGPAVSALVMMLPFPKKALKEADKDLSPQEAIRAVAPAWALPTGLQSATWTSMWELPEVHVGGPFLIVQPTKAVGKERSRGVSPGEVFNVSSISKGRVSFLDPRAPVAIPRSGVIRATACPGTSWERKGKDRVAIGRCTATAAKPTSVHDPAKLRNAELPAHYHQPSIARSVIDSEIIEPGSLRCIGGPVGRLFVDTPTCPVSFNQILLQRRSVPLSAGIATTNRTQAAQISFLLQGEFLGEARKELAYGRIAEGLPYAWFTKSQPDLRNCMGRAIHAKGAITDGKITFTCSLSGQELTFRGLSLVQIRALDAP